MAAIPRLGPAAFHGVAGRVVTALEPHTEADPAGLLLTLLTVTGSAVGGGPHAVADGARHPAKINTLLVGATSRGRKGTAWQQIKSVMKHADPGWCEARITGGLASGEGLVAQVADSRADPADKRLLVCEPEFARVLTVAGRDGSTLSHIVREAWDGDTIRVTTRHDPLVATGAHISIVAQITAEELQHRLTRTDQANGFANRFLFTWVERTKLLPSGGDPAPDLYSRLGGEVRAQLEDFRRLVRLIRTPEAEDFWAEIYAQMAEDAPAGMLGAITGRAEAQVLRLSVIYAGLDGTSKIDVPHIKAAWACWRYCEATVAHLFDSATGNRVADTILGALKEAATRGAGLDTTQQYGLFSRHLRKRELDEALGLLADLGLTETLDAATGGRPRKVVFYRDRDLATAVGE